MLQTRPRRLQHTDDAVAKYGIDERVNDALSVYGNLCTICGVEPEQAVARLIHHQLHDDLRLRRVLPKLHNP